MRRIVRGCALALMVIAGIFGGAEAAFAWGGLIAPAPAAKAKAPEAGVATSAIASPATVKSRAIGAADPAAAVAALAAAPGLLQIGVPDVGSVPPSGFGKSVPLRLALKMLVPRYWATNTIRIDESTPVSWVDGQSWAQALNEITKVHGWSGTIDWGAHMVTIEGGGMVSLAHSASALAPSPVPPAVVTPPPAPHFDLVAGLALSQQLTEWGKRSGWSVVWDLPSDWVVPANASFPGRFEVALGGVVSTLSQAGIDVRADIYRGNKTVVIHRSASTVAGQ